MAPASSSIKQVTLANAKQAAGGVPPVSCGPGCKRCRRVDLQLLVTLPSIVPKEYSKPIADNGYVWAPAMHPEFSNLARKATLPVARVARKGYIMVYFKERKCWDVWQVLDFGLTIKKMHQVTAEQYAKFQLAGVKSPGSDAVCSRKAANLTAQMICIEGANSVNAVWVAFTDYLWTPATLARYAANPDVEIAGADGKPKKVPLQATRGREISPKGILNGKVPACGLPLNADNLQRHLVDYVKSAPANFTKAFSDALKPFDIERAGKASECADQVRAIEKASGPAGDRNRYVDKSVVVLVPDPIGVADTHNKLRATALADRFAWEGGGPDVTGKNADPNRPWKRQSLLHAAYIRGRVRHEALENEKQRLGAERLGIDNSAISAERYKLAKALEAQGKSPYPAGTMFEPFDNGRAYRIIYPPEYIAKKAEAQADAQAAGRIARYNKHLNWPAIEKYNATWLSQEKGWLTLLKERDEDYVTWMQHPEFKVAIQYDFDDGAALSKAKKKKEEVERDVHDIAARIDATARCYGSGALADASLKFLFGEFNKELEDRSHHVAAAMFKPFSIFDKLLEDKDAGTIADFYDAFDSVKNAGNEFKEAWEKIREPAASGALILSLTAQQIAHRMEEVARLPEIGAKQGLKSALKDATQKKVIWARAAGLHNYLETGNRVYHIKVKWKAGAFAAAATEPTLNTMALDIGSYIKQKRRAAARARSTNGLNSLIAAAPANVELTVPLVIDEARLRAAALRRGEPMLEVVGGGMFGVPRGVVSLPKSLAEAVVTEQTHFSWGKLKTGSTYLNLFVLYLQTSAAIDPFADIQKKGGFDQIDAAASLISGVAGVTGALTELAVIAMTPRAANRAGMPLAAELASKVPWHLRLALAASVLTSAGALFDSVAAWAKSRGRKAQGDADAAHAYFNAFALQAISSAALAGAAFYSYRAAVLQRLGTEAALNVLGSAFSPVILARCLTGLGMLLWVAGLGYSIYAMYMEDDVNEIYLRRSIFGMGHPQLGSFPTLEHEMQAFMALSIGMTAELEWKDKISEADELKAVVKVFKPEPGDVITAVIEGFTAVNKKRIMEIYRGDLPVLTKDPEDKDDVLYLTEKSIKIPAGVKAIRMTYFLYKNRKGNATPEARNELWIED